MCVFRRGIASLCDVLTFGGAFRVLTKVTQPFYMAISTTYGVLFHTVPGHSVVLTGIFLVGLKQCLTVCLTCILLVRNLTKNLFT